jgi:hypothetical protein
MQRWPHFYDNLHVHAGHTAASSPETILLVALEVFSCICVQLKSGIAARSLQYQNKKVSVPENICLLVEKELNCNHVRLAFLSDLNRHRIDWISQTREEDAVFRDFPEKSPYEVWKPPEKQQFFCNRPEQTKQK